MEVLENVITDYGVTTRKLNAFINKRVNCLFCIKQISRRKRVNGRVFDSKSKFFAALQHKRIIKQKCKEISEPYIDFIKCYSRYSNKSNFRKTAKVLLRRYEIFSAAFQYVIVHYKQSDHLWVITDIWFEIIRKLEKEAKRNTDFAACNIATQMRIDMDFYLELYEVKPT